MPVYPGQVYDASKTPLLDRPAIHVTAARVAQANNGQFPDAGNGRVDEDGAGS